MTDSIRIRLPERAQEILGADDELLYPGLEPVEGKPDHFDAPAITASHLAYDLLDHADRKGLGWDADAEERAYCRRIGKAIEKRIEQ